MNAKHFFLIILTCIFTIPPFNLAMAEGGSFLDALLRFTGISVTADKVKGVDGFMTGNIWWAHIEETGSSQPRQITRDGTYHTPLWIPGSLAIIAMKGGNLVSINALDAGEKTLHALPDTTALLGFDKNDPDRILVLQEAQAGVLALTSGKITAIPYDKGNPEDRMGLDQLMSGYRDYGTAKVEIENQLRHDSRKKFQQSNTINIKQGNNKIISISCPSACAQPALAEDGRQLLFIGD